MVGEVEERDEHPDTFTPQPIPVQVSSHHAGHKVLPCAGPAVEGEDQSLLWLWALQEPSHCPDDNFFGQVLPVELLVEIQFQPWRKYSKCSALTLSPVAAAGSMRRCCTAPNSQSPAGGTRVQEEP